VRRSTRPALVLPALLTAAVALAGCSVVGGEPSTPPSPQPGSTVAPKADLQSFYAQRPRWTGCGGSFECTTIDVPLDYAAPAGTTLELALIRLPAKDRGARQGSLLINPGGPGVSGLEYARAARAAFTDEVRTVYDVVGFDPRGVGESSPVDCVSDDELDAFLAIDGSPDSPAEEQALLAASRSFAQGCLDRSEAWLPHLGTEDAARDMDVIRAVLGDAQLTFFGASYGTFLGATYAELFPGKVRRMVLDGAVDPALDAVQISKGQLAGFEEELNGFLADCAGSGSCPLGGSSAAARQRLERLLADIDARPLDVGGRPLTQSLALLGIVYPLYDQRAWPTLRVALDRALDGDGSALMLLADIYTDRKPGGGGYKSNRDEATYAVNCADREDSSTVADTRALAAELARQSSVFGAYLAWSNLPCAVWPVPAAGRPRALRAAGAPPIVVIGTTRDPATPYAWAKSLATELESGRLLTYDGRGHTAYTRGSRCIDRAVDAYLVSGTLPAEGTVCR